MKKYIIISILFVMLTSCANKENKTETTEKINETSVELTDAQLKNSDIQTGKIEQRTISSLLKVNGKIEVPPQNMVSVSVPIISPQKHISVLLKKNISDKKI